MAKFLLKISISVTWILVTMMIIVASLAPSQTVYAQSSTSQFTIYQDQPEPTPKPDETVPPKPQPQEPTKPSQPPSTGQTGAGKPTGMVQKLAGFLPQTGDKLDYWLMLIGVELISLAIILGGIRRQKERAYDKEAH
ncbi:hypothetical protein JCM14202_662 [Agrilactobacillus composti DSM 18527 = JCM 14202]|nr:LPXTG cell wall anchor domain-containing protein [Agrilactobacillus composti]GAF38832.1 hypothetical protein JCM14202_662 [Agrilactobacillus composti DSM 18527 = JCM 14202]